MSMTALPYIKKYNEVLKRMHKVDPLLEVYESMRHDRMRARNERDDVCKAIKKLRSCLFSTLRLAKDMNEVLLRSSSKKDRQLIEALTGRFHRLESRLIREAVITKGKKGYK